MKISKCFSFDAAHVLPNHKGKCSNVHGHTYRLEVSVGVVRPPEWGPESEGMVLDFGDLKAAVHQAFLDEWDHSFLVRDEQEAAGISGWKPYTKVAVLGVASTAENLAALATERLWSALGGIYGKAADPLFVQVRVWETPDSSAETDLSGAIRWLSIQTSP